MGRGSGSTASSMSASKFAKPVRRAGQFRRVAVTRKHPAPDGRSAAGVAAAFIRYTAWAAASCASRGSFTAVQQGGDAAEPIGATRRAR